MRRVARITITTAILATALAAVAWRMSGGGFYAVQTASMGTAAPVGTLVLDEPAGRLHVGEIISFHPPGTDEIFTHRIARLDPDGTIETKGDADGAVDPWQLDRREILGRAVTTIRYLGWLLEAIPILVPGLAVAWLLTYAFVAPEWRTAARGAAFLAVTMLAIAVLSPLINSDVISFARGAGDGAAGEVVSTGLLPLRVAALGGTAQTITDGQVARVTTRQLQPHHRFELQVAPDWQFWWILPLASLTLLPACLSLTVRERDPQSVASTVSVIASATSARSLSDSARTNSVGV